MANWLAILAQRLLNQSPRHQFVVCHEMLNQIVLRAWHLLPDLDTEPSLRWGQYTVAGGGLIAPSHAPHAFGERALMPLTDWSAVSGVGMEMSPLYEYMAPGQDRSGRAKMSFDTRVTRLNTGYQFSILIVMIKGPTYTIGLPIRTDGAAIDFTAHLLAYARSHDRRLSLMGFDKALTRQVVHLEAF